MSDDIKKRRRGRPPGSKNKTALVRLVKAAAAVAVQVGTPNKPKGEQLVVALESAEREVRALILAGDRITALGKDRLAELDEWAYGLAKKFAPREDDKGYAHWQNPGDEARFMRFFALAAKCALGRAAFESPRYAAVAVAN
jgi:hypothetical protein